MSNFWGLFLVEFIKKIIISKWRLKKSTILLLKLLIMADPFFTTGNSSQVNNPQNQWWNDNTSQIIENLMSQQQQIQTKYKELKELLHTQNLTQNQQQEVYEQMQKLSDLYSQNKATLASLTTSISWEKEIHVNKNVDTENAKWRGFSFKKFMIGCGILLMLFLGWLVLIFSSLMKDPNRLIWFGIDGCTAVNLLQIFSIVFFWLLGFLGLSLLLLNINRLLTVKNKRKTPYVFWVFFSFILLITVWILLINMLQNLSKYQQECGDRWDTQLAHPHAIIKNSKFKEAELPRSEYNKLIAPMNISFDLNTTEVKNRTLKLWASNVTNVRLSCWNWQELQLWTNSSSFNWTCFYTKAWTYQPEVIIDYIDSALAEKQQKYPIWQDISIKSEISILSNKTTIGVQNSSFLVWKNPVTLNLDASAVFRDFNLPYDIKWSAECNWIWDNIWSVDFKPEYPNEWVYEICVTFPALSQENVYTFPFRVEQWETQDEFSISYTVTSSSSSKTYDNPNSIEVTQLPTTLTLEVVSVTPDNGSVQRKLYKDGVQIPSEFSNKNLFKIVIDEDKPQELVLEIANTEKQISTQKTIGVSVNKKNIIGVLKVSPQTVWMSPFEVKFDASTTSLNDPTDEIVYFSRDFWDGVKNQNLSESIISHIYEYDFINENGVYYPSVTIRTKKWLTVEITWTIINVKKPDTTLEISLENNPAQLASVLQDVPMSITVDWMPKKIYREYWDWETLECDWRSCAETSHTYIQDWTYSIIVKVEFEDKPTLEWKINLVVK